MMNYYRLDMARYKNQASFYIRLLHFTYRKYFETKSSLVKLIYKASFRFLASRRGIEISLKNQIGKGLYLGHAYNITINPDAIIGSNCNLHKGILIGQQNRGKLKGTPTIGNYVWIGINAAIVGDIKIGDDVLIAPNSYVNCDIPSHSVVFGNPCVIKSRDKATEDYINNIV